MADIRMVAVDVDGTFIRHDYSFDTDRFQRILDRMDEVGAQFVIASGNQYWQLRDYFPGYDERISFVAENGAYVKDHDQVVFVGEIDRATTLATLTWIEGHSDITNVMSCENCAYVERGRMPEDFFEFMRTYYHRMEWVDSLRAVDDREVELYDHAARDFLLLFCHFRIPPCALTSSRRASCGDAAGRFPSASCGSASCAR